MKILIISSSFYPEISPRSFRATELVREFYRQGHDVKVITRYRDFDYSGFLKSFPVNFKMWGRPKFRKLPEFRQMPISAFSRLISRILLLLFEYPAIEEMFLVRRVLANESGYDLMISFAVPYPVHWGVSRIRSKDFPIARIWIADCGDPYMFGRLDSFRKPFWFSYPEKKFCRKCDYITVPFREMQKQFYPEFINKIRVIPQGFNFEDITLHPAGPDKNKTVFIFAGSVIPGKRDLSLFLEFISSLSVDFQFVVYTKQKAWFETYRNLLGEKLVIKDYIDRLQLIYEMSKADFLVNVDSIHDVKDNIEAIPSKLIDYTLSERPILNLNSGLLDKDMVMEFLNKDYRRRRLIRKSDYDIKKVSSQFLELVNK
jgi:hypothetical protein